MVFPYCTNPQLLGLALGMSPDELAFGDLRVKASKIIEQITQGATNQ
jgi:heterodisulfide reductase subunit B